MAKVYFEELIKILEETGTGQVHHDAFIHAQYNSAFQNTAIGSGQAKSILINEGITYFFVDQYVEEDIIMEARTQYEAVALTICISGYTEVFLPQFDKWVSFHQGKCYFMLTPPIVLLHHIPAGFHYRMVNVYMDRSLFEQLVTSYEDNVPAVLRKALMRDNQLEVMEYASSTSAEMIANMIMTPPYTGMAGRFYMESKVNELIALQLNDLMNELRPVKTTLKIHQADYDKLEEGRQLLLQRVDRPPTLDELARELGMSRNKLKIGFKQHFGKSPFEMIREQRMSMARDLLLSYSVTEVADKLGYSSVGHFSNAFKDYYGHRPRLK